ncbi:hypothetical protein HKX48_009252 [Thoreauomyces humboldtii]|nr:hypothetical protein HKX48_009252 [Thoreauomyces humboldtii]
MRASINLPDADPLDLDTYPWNPRDLDENWNTRKWGPHQNVATLPFDPFTALGGVIAVLREELAPAAEQASSSSARQVAVPEVSPTLLNYVGTGSVEALPPRVESNEELRQELARTNERLARMNERLENQLARTNERLENLTTDFQTMSTMTKSLVYRQLYGQIRAKVRNLAPYYHIEVNPRERPTELAGFADLASRFSANARAMEALGTFSCGQRELELATSVTRFTESPNVPVHGTPDPLFAATIILSEKRNQQTWKNVFHLVYGCPINEYESHLLHEPLLLHHTSVTRTH